MWAAMLYKDPKVGDALHKILVLKSHLSLPEPGGTLLSPTHFNTGTAADTANDQWAWPSRDLAMSMIDDSALYTVWSRVGVPNVTDMHAKVKKGIESIDGETQSNATPGHWKEVHWVETLNFAYDQYDQGFDKTRRPRPREFHADEIAVSGERQFHP